MNKRFISDRKKARHHVLQAIYQWSHTGASAKELEQQFITEEFTDGQGEYFTDLVRGVLEHVDELDALIKESVDRPLEELNPVELAALRLGVFELKYRNDVPTNVAINEAVELTKTFGAVDGFKYVNGVLDAVAKKLR